MPLPILNFHTKTFEEANPEMMASQYSADLLTKAIENQKRIIANKYFEPTLEQQLEQLRLNTDILRPRAQYAPQFTEAELMEAMLRPKKMEADINNLLLGPEKTKADIAYILAQTANLPKDLNLRREIFEFQKNKFNNPNIMQFGRAISSLPAEQRKAFLAAHPEYEDLLLSLGNQVQGNTSNNIPNADSNNDTFINDPNLGQGLGLGLGLGTGAPTGGTPINSIYDPRNYTKDIFKNDIYNPESYVNDIAQLNNKNNTNNSFFDKSKEKRDSLILANQLSANNAMIDRATEKMANNAIIMEKWAHDNREEFSKKILNASKYAGAKGISQKAVDMLAKSNPDAYADYKWIKENFAKNMGNKIRLMEGSSATNEQTKILDNMLNTIQWDVSPEQAIRLANDIFSNMSSMAHAVLTTAEPLYPGIRRKIAGLPEYNPNEKYIKYPEENKAKYTQEDLEYTAKEMGMTVEQVKEFMKKEGVL